MVGIVCFQKRTVEDASPYKFDEILNLGNTPYDVIMVSSLSFSLYE